jgi:3-hydroxyisobutyrate dehydrogenase-like beta-hydroxyacid dehydrogenase
MNPSTTAVTRTGMIGLGAMGLQMARHMAAKGFDVRGYDIDAGVMQRAQAQDLRTASAAEVAAHSEVVIVMVATDDQVREATHLLLERLAPDSVVCIASSVAPETCRELAALAARRGVGVLDTPVVLGQEAANNGTLTIYAGGEERWFERARPALAAFGAKVLYLGGPGSGQIAKTINNMLLWACMTANMEALTLAKQLGADIPRLVTALKDGSGANWSLSRWGKSTGKWSVKDMDVAMKLAQAAGVPAPLGGLVDQLVKGINQERMKALLS